MELISLTHFGPLTLEATRLPVDEWQDFDYMSMVSLLLLAAAEAQPLYHNNLQAGPQLYSALLSSLLFALWLSCQALMDR